MINSVYSEISKKQSECIENQIFKMINMFGCNYTKPSDILNWYEENGYALKMESIEGEYKIKLVDKVNNYTLALFYVRACVAYNNNFSYTYNTSISKIYKL